MKTTDTRPATTKLIDMMEEGTLDPLTLAKACIGYMSEADVQDMAESEGFIDSDDELEDEIDFDEYDSDEFDVEAMKADYANGNFSEDDSEDYRVENIVRLSLTNGQRTQAKSQCVKYGLDYETELSKFKNDVEEI